jgi:hypothetical protein
MDEGNMARRLFVDMDGVLAKFTPVAEIESLYEEGYFRNLGPQENVVIAVRGIITADETDVYILSGVLADSEYAWDEKRQWLKEHLPELTDDEVIFVPCGMPKTDQGQWFSAGGGLADTARSPICESDILLDDYTANLTEWEAGGGKGIKLINDINHQRGVWQGATVSYMSPPAEIAEDINMKIVAEENLSGEENKMPGPSEKMNKVYVYSGTTGKLVYAGNPLRIPYFQMPIAVSDVPIYDSDEALAFVREKTSLEHWQRKWGKIPDSPVVQGGEGIESVDHIMEDIEAYNSYVRAADPLEHALDAYDAEFDGPEMEM